MNSALERRADCYPSSVGVGQMLTRRPGYCVVSQAEDDVGHCLQAYCHILT
jgi:hypothetical protein